MSHCSEDFFPFEIVPTRLSPDLLEGSWRQASEEPTSSPRPSAIVTPGSSFELREAVERTAWFFQREFAQTAQFSATETPDDIDYIEYKAFLWAGNDLNGGAVSIVGACCFRRQDRYERIGPFWDLQWAWFHPYCRRQGFLRSSWGYFESRFGQFRCQPPLSLEMQSFLKKHNGGLRRAFPPGFQIDDEYLTAWEQDSSNKLKRPGIRSITASL